MEQINTIMLTDEKVFPDDIVLKEVLRKSFPAYTALLEIYKNNGLECEWRYYKDGKAWLCKVQYKKKTIVWMSAFDGYLKATMYIPDKYSDMIDSIDISEDTKQRIKDTKNVGKSKPYMFDIKNKSILTEFEIVMKHKMELK